MSTRSGSAFVLGVSLAACGPAPRPVHSVLVCDRSTSALCDERRVQRAALQFLDRNLPAGSRFEVLATGCDSGDVVPVYRVEVPSSWGGGVIGRKKGWRENEQKTLAALVLPPLRHCSGIAAAIWQAGNLLGEAAQMERHLAVASDLREVSSELGNFERKVPSPSVFVERLRGAALLPDLSGVTLEACSVDNRATIDAPHWSARSAQQLRAAWRAAFSAMHIRGDIVFRETCSFDREPGAAAPARGEL